MDANNSPSEAVQQVQGHGNNLVYSFKDLPAATRKLVLQQLIETCDHEELFLIHSVLDKRRGEGNCNGKQRSGLEKSNHSYSLVTKDLVQAFNPRTVLPTLFKYSEEFLKARYPLYSTLFSNGRGEVNHSHISRSSSSVLQIDFFKWLPTELSLKILLKLDISSIVAVCKCSRYHQHLIEGPHADTYLWRILCERDYNATQVLDQMAFRGRLLQPGHRTKRKLYSTSSSGSKKSSHAQNVANLPFKSYRETYLNFHLTRTNWRNGNYQVKDFTNSARKSAASTAAATPAIMGSNHSASLYVGFDDTRAVSVGRNQVGRVWSLVNGQVVSLLQGHEGGISCAKLNQRYIVTGSSDATVRVWCSNSGTCFRTMQGHDGEITSLFLGSSEEEGAENIFVFSGSEDQTIIAWDKNGNICCRFRGHNGPVLCLQADRNILVSGSSDNTIKIWSLQSTNQGDCINTLTGHTGEVYCLQFREDCLISGSGDSTIKIWNLGTGTCRKTLRGHNGGVLCLQFDHCKLVSGSIDFTIKIWDLNNFSCLQTLCGHRGAIWSLCFDGPNRLLSSALDMSLLVWDFSAENHPILATKRTTSNDEEEY